MWPGRPDLIRTQGPRVRHQHVDDDVVQNHRSVIMCGTAPTGKAVGAIIHRGSV